VERHSLAKSYAAHTSWAKTDDRAKRTASGRAAFEAGFIRDAGGDLDRPLKDQSKDVRLRAISARKAFFAGIQLKAIQARAARKAAEMKDANPR
jgi:hypothetical protein